MAFGESGAWRFLVACLLGVVLSLMVYTFYLTEAWAYFSDDPSACANCHVMEAPLSSWTASSHHATAGCNDCHAPRAGLARGIRQAVNGVRHGWSFTFGSGGLTHRLGEKNSRVLETNCIRCHAAILPTSHGEEPIGRGRCTRCHREAGHS